jgi:hypothetical protein
MADTSLGTYTFEKETPGTRRYQSKSESGRKETIYIPKATAEKMSPPNPESFELIART